ncbi:thermonuclease family protein [Paenibacillus sp. SYP-B3998]|uniref:Thermonuclease family protein n=1 Tax=Paenibacillus sp. SYP-B3998 TaxID=2678564 RepID=A0A6G3ZV36_9BACL|nr:thermonuclease family protein [Paenibacillus sp. SYP-B3998]NEW05441.1 thermonuclease family protein [Paenibacillus sp. SYP-B3998]
MRTWSVALCLFLVISVTAGCASKTTSVPGRERVKVERIVDGDTLEVTRAGKKEKVRLIGVDTPETKKPNTPVMFYGKEASDYTKKRLEKQSVDLEFDVEKEDRFDRLLAYVWIGDELFNRTLVQEGFARMATFPPNVKYADSFKKDQEQARAKSKGLWKDYDRAFDAKK